jgi:hypothetical protein
MKTFSFFIVMLCMSLSAFAQHTLILDDGFGHYITILPPSNLVPGTSTYSLPTPPGTLTPSGFLAAGTIPGQIPVLSNDGTTYSPLNPGGNGQLLTMTNGGPGWTDPPVRSVFGRTGTVIAAVADYNFGQIAGTASASQLPTLQSMNGLLDFGHGGTGQTTANAALNALLPSQGTSSGMVLQTNGSNTSWKSISTGVDFAVTDGHFQSKQTTIVTAALQAGAGTTASITSTSGCTDIAGKLTILTSGAGLAAGNQCKVTFHKVFGVAPIVIVTPGNVNTANNIPYISSVTTTDFTIAFSGVPGNSQTQDFYYQVIETQ